MESGAWRVAIKHVKNRVWRQYYENAVAGGAAGTTTHGALALRCVTSHVWMHALGLVLQLRSFL